MNSLIDGNCPACDDGEGGCVFSHYGVAPHVCAYKLGVGPSYVLPPEQWPENFLPDGIGCGVYTHCLECGRPSGSLIDGGMV